MTRAWLGIILGGLLWAAPVPASSALAADNSPGAATCVAMGLPAVQGVEGSAVDVGNAVRELFRDFLRGPSITVVELDARLASQASDEARQKGCQRILTATLTRKRSSGGRLGRVLGHAGSAAAWHMPGRGVGGAVARGAALAGAQAVSELAVTTRAKDEMKLEFQLQALDGRVLLERTEEKLKASVDGEDLLTPLVRKASESIVASLPAPR